MPWDAARTLAAVATIAAASSGWSAGKLAPLPAAALLAGGLAVLGAGMRRQAEAERLAQTLCGAPGSARQPLSASLAQLAAQLDAGAHRLGNTHPVTGLPTREHLQASIETDIAKGLPHLIGALRFADFDRLAAFDLEAANVALRHFAARLVGATKTRHVIAQIDRDCFCIWFRSEGDLEQAAAEFRAIVYVASQELTDDGALITPAIEMAALRFPEDGGDAAHLLLRVTAALARPTLSPVGELTLVRPPSVEAARKQFKLEQQLAQAIDEDQLAMVFQPVVDLAAGRLIGAEALLRWDHPELGAVSPAQFIPMVEALGMSDRYGLWVLNTACREARRWHDEGLRGLKVAANLSARQLLDPGLATKVERTLKRHGLAAGTLELELTETAAMADAGRTLHLFAELRAKGVTLAIDDFGSGYSSLSYLKNLPFDKLKIDREFITLIQDRPDSRAICKALIELGRGLGLRVLAEGVESAQEVAALRRLGCDLFQGYYFSKPLPGEDFRRLARDEVWAHSLVNVPAPSPLVGGRVSA